MTTLSFAPSLSLSRILGGDNQCLLSNDLHGKGTVLHIAAGDSQPTLEEVVGIVSLVCPRLLLVEHERKTPLELSLHLGGPNFGAFEILEAPTIQAVEEYKNHRGHATSRSKTVKRLRKFQSGEVSVDKIRAMSLNQFALSIAFGSIDLSQGDETIRDALNRGDSANKKAKLNFLEFKREKNELTGNSQSSGSSATLDGPEHVSIGSADPKHVERPRYETFAQNLSLHDAARSTDPRSLEVFEALTDITRLDKKDSKGRTPFDLTFESDGELAAKKREVMLKKGRAESVGGKYYKSFSGIDLWYVKNPREFTKFNMTYIELAACNPDPGSLEAFQEMLRKDPTILTDEKLRSSLLFVALQNLGADCSKIFFSLNFQKSDLALKDASEKTLLQVAAESRNPASFPVFKFLYEETAKAGEEADDIKMTRLIAKSNTSFHAVLIRKMLGVEVKKFITLHDAARSTDPSSLKVFEDVTDTTRLDKKDSKGRTPFDLTFENDGELAAKKREVMLKKGRAERVGGKRYNSFSDINLWHVKNPREFTKLNMTYIELAACNPDPGSLEAFQVMLRKDPTILTDEKLRSRLLFVALQNLGADCSKIFFSLNFQKSDLALKDASGKTLLQVAAESRNPASFPVFKFLYEETAKAGEEADDIKKARCKAESNTSFHAVLIRKMLGVEAKG